MGKKNILRIGKGNSNFNGIELLLGLFVFLSLLFIYQTLPKKGDSTTANEQETQNSVITGAFPKEKGPISEEDLKEEDGKYIDSELRFLFRYPLDAEVLDCEENKCIYLPEYSVRIQFLDQNYFSRNFIKEELLGFDLFCSYQTDLIDVSCTNVKMNDFTNALGTDGFILYRTKYIRQTDIYQEVMKNITQHEKVYLFPLDNEKYGLAIFSVDTSTEENQEVLLKIVNSFKNI